MLIVDTITIFKNQNTGYYIPKIPDMQLPWTKKIKSDVIFDQSISSFLKLPSTPNKSVADLALPGRSDSLTR